MLSTKKNKINMFNLFRKNDWYTVWSKSSYWIDDSYGKYYPRHIPVSFEILFSESRNKYKLKSYGHRSKLHPVYSEAVNKLNFFIGSGHGPK